MSYYPELIKFLLQAKEGSLKTKSYIKKLGQLSVRVSFGQGAPARVPWIAFLHDTQNVQKGIYPVLLYYQSQSILVLAYGISETEKPLKQWPSNITSEAVEIKDYLKGKQERYGNSFVYKAYKIDSKKKEPVLLESDTGELISAEVFDSNLSAILDLYIEALGDTEESASEIVKQEGVEDIVGFGLEAQLEDFIVSNWDKLDFVKEYEIYKENGNMIGKQYVTDLGRIDILAKKKDGKGWLVIELKKGKTSEKVVGQLAHYMGYVKINLAEESEKIKGIIIAGDDDKRIKYAVERDPDITFLTYSVKFNLRKPFL